MDVSQHPAKANIFARETHFHTGNTKNLASLYISALAS